jgi:hypothetical protein
MDLPEPGIWREGEDGWWLSRKATGTDRVCWMSVLVEWMWCWDEASVGRFEGVVDIQRSVNESLVVG